MPDGAGVRDRRLSALRQRFSLVGAVHGMGLCPGPELARDRVTLKPATAETETLCRRLPERGVIMQPAGDHLNVLEIEPPCLTRASAAFFVAMLSEALAGLEATARP